LHSKVIQKDNKKKIKRKDFFKIKKNQQIFFLIFLFPFENIPGRFCCSNIEQI